MLQVELKTFASDALEDAMRLAQTKALNSYSWSDCLNYLNYTWSDIYNRIVMIDAGYYSTTVQLNTAMTKLPPFVKSSIRIYGAEDPVGFNREIFRASGMADLRARNTYHISGFDLYCPDATRRTVWLNFVPSPPMLFFPRNNRDPKLYENTKEKPLELLPPGDDYHLYGFDRKAWDESEHKELWLRHKNPVLLNDFIDLNSLINREHEDLIIHFISCDFPYIFVTYKHSFIPNYFVSGFYKDILTSVEFIEYNPFEFTGRRSNVEYLQCKWNDKTGLGVIVRDYDDYDVGYYMEHKKDIIGWDPPEPNAIPGSTPHNQWLQDRKPIYIDEDKIKIYRIKELGYTPDTILTYPCPEMYRYLVARLADKFAAFNESEVMGIAKELVEAKYAFEAFCAKDKSSWQRIDNVNGPYMTDWL